MAAIPVNTNVAPGTEVAVTPVNMNYGGILEAKSLATVLEEERARAQAALDKPGIQGLAAYIRQCWTSARDAKRPITQRMLEAVRARRGEYDPDKLEQIKKHGGSEIYAMLTSVKCRAAASWIRDVLMGQGGDRPWTVRPTKVPELSPEHTEMIVQQAAAPIAQAMAAGVPMPDEQIRQMMSQMYDQMKTELRTKAREHADRMSDKMEDQLLEGNWLSALDAFIDDVTTFPAAIIKGPVVRNKPVLCWVDKGDGTYEPKVETKLRLEWERVDPFRLFPARDATTIDDGYLIEHHRLTRAALQELIGVEGYDESSIKTVLDEFGRGGLREWLTDETAKDAAEGRSNITQSSPDGLIDAIQFWGSVQGKWLIEWGMSEEEIPDPTREYNVEAWLIGPYVIKATLNSDPLMRKPYYKACYEEVPGSFWGNSVADLVRDTQIVVNATARALVNNMGISSGPQVGVNVSRIPQGEDVTQMYPWKIWQFENDPMGGTGDPIQFFMPETRVQELMAVFEKFSQLADEYSGIPRYMSGENPGSLGRTASGLSMLIGNASKSIKQVIANIDNHVMTPALQRLYYYNMRFGDDVELKGDVEVVARGASSILAKEAAQVRRNEFLAATANPIDMQIVGVEGRAAILREVASSLDMEVDRVVPPDDVLKARLAAQAMMMQAQPQPGAPGGPSASGQELQNGAPVRDDFSPPKNNP